MSLYRVKSDFSEKYLERLGKLAEHVLDGLAALSAKQCVHASVLELLVTIVGHVHVERDAADCIDVLRQVGKGNAQLLLKVAQADALLGSLGALGRRFTAVAVVDSLAEFTA